MLCRGQFGPYFEPVNPIGESSREKTRTGGEGLRGTRGVFASFLCVHISEVRVFGSEEVFRRDAKHRRCEAVDPLYDEGEEIREVGFCAVSRL